MSRRPKFHFRRLVRKYSRPITAYVQREGTYDGGVYKPGITDSFVLHGAVIAMKRTAVNDVGGNYIQEDKHLYTLTPIVHPLDGVKILFDGQLYAVTVNRDHGNETFTGVYAYFLTWISKFQKEKKDAERL